MLLLVDTETPPAERTRDGVIEDARTRQRRRRRAGALTLIAAAAASLLGLSLTGGGAGGSAASASTTPLAPLTGSPLTTPTHLRLVAAENAGRPSLVDVDTGVARPIAGLGLPAHAQVGGGDAYTVYPLTTLADGRALAVVNHQPCAAASIPAGGRQARCSTERSEYAIAADGAATLVAQMRLGYHQSAALLPGSASAWVLTWPHRGACTLTLEPGSHPSVVAPCGPLGPVTAAGLWIGNRLVDPHSGSVVQTVATATGTDVVSVLPGGLVLEADSSHSHLVLLDPATGARRTLAWPSRLRFAVRVLPSPTSHAVALYFGQPWVPNTHRPVNQAFDLWLLDPARAKLTHAPGFPALEYLKFSGVAWSPDGRLVVAARDDHRTLVGIWRPGERTLRVKRVPPLDGYTDIVALRH